MSTTYGRFPGVQVTVAGGGITSVAIGEEEKLVLFGEASYQNDGGFPGDGNEDSLETDLTGSTESPYQINARRQADVRFGDGSKLADAMREALANGANISFLYGVAPKRINVVDESLSSQTGTLDNFPIYEDNVSDESNIENVEVSDVSNSDDHSVEFSYDGAPATPSAGDTIVINPLTGEYAADSAPDGSNYNISYKYLDWEGAFTATDVVGAIEEDETGIFAPLTDADSVSDTLSTEVSSLREEEWKLINVVSGAEPNDNQVVTSDGNSLESDHSNYTRRDPRYDTQNYDTANQSIDADYYFKVAPARLEDQKRTGLGGVGGLFAGNPIDDPIYNDQLEYDAFEQSFTKLDADNMRDENIIPIRQAGSVRVRDNISTSTETDWERDFWRRRIADRVVLVGKLVGDSIIGQINDEDTRNAAQRLIRQEMRELVADRLIRPNTQDEENWFVEVYEDSDNTNQVNIDIGFTPYGVVKRVEETITINT